MIKLKESILGKGGGGVYYTNMVLWSYLLMMTYENAP